MTQNLISEVYVLTSLLLRLRFGSVDQFFNDLLLDVYIKTQIADESENLKITCSLSGIS